MKVIFIKDLKGQGKRGDRKEVKDGYAENFLIKNGYAVKETNESLAKLNRDNKNEELKDQEMRRLANLDKAKLEKEKFTFQVKAGKEDKVFGSISAKQIKEKMDEKGYSVDKKNIIIDSQISSLGFHKVKVILYKDITAEINVELVK